MTCFPFRRVRHAGRTGEASRFEPFSVVPENEPVTRLDVGSGAGREFDDQIGTFAGEASPRVQPLDALDDVVDDPDGIDWNENEQHVEVACLRRPERKHQRVLGRQ